MQRIWMIWRSVILFSLITVYSATAFAQVSNTLTWTWMKGDNGSNSPGIYGVLGVAASANKPGARETGGIQWTDASGNLWLFGGYGFPESGAQGFLNDLWKYDPATNNWTWMNGNKTINNTGIYGTKGVPSFSNIPGARYLADAWVDNSGNLWLFGGYGYGASGAGYLNDLWKYNIASNMWTWVNGDNTLNNAGIYGTRGIAASTNKPGARNRFNQLIGKVDAAGYFWMFGGAGYATTTSYGALNDLWKYNTATNEWTWVSGDNTGGNLGVYGTMGTPAPANKPGGRVGGVCWLDTAGKLWLFGGGYDASGGWTFKLSDLWKFDPTSGEWTWMKGDNVFDQFGVYNTQGVPNATSKPGGRLMSACWLDNIGNFWLFAGYGWAAPGMGSNGNQGLSDLWKYDPLTNNWTWMKGDNAPGQFSNYGTIGVPASTNKPGNRSGVDHWIDAKGNLWEFGGLEWIPTVFKNDLWKLVIPQPVAKGNLVSCQPLPTVTIDATNNNVWVPIFDSIGNIAAEINANTNNLGIVSTSLFTKTGACREDGSNRLYLNRNITISVQTQPSSAVSVRLYMLKAELDSLRTAMNSQNQPSGVASINEVDVFKNNDSCRVAGGSTALPLTATTGTYNSDFYLQVNSSSFSSFFFANKLLTAILPVKIKTFTGIRSVQANILNWEASCNAPVNFNIERSSDGIHFEIIGNVIGTAADCNQPFSFTDNKPALTNNYYRLQINETGGAVSYSSIILLQENETGKLHITLQPNLVRSSIINIKLVAENSERMDFFISDVTGQTLVHQLLNVQSGINNVSLNVPGLAPGIYWLYGFGKEGKTNVVRFVKQ